jgi:hypothetical protein
MERPPLCPHVKLRCGVQAVGAEEGGKGGEGGGGRGERRLPMVSARVSEAQRSSGSTPSDPIRTESLPKYS